MAPLVVSAAVPHCVVYPGTLRGGSSKRTNVQVINVYRSCVGQFEAINFLITKKLKFIFCFPVNPNTCLQAHNAKRKLHVETSPLVWDATLAQHAQSWANRLASEGKMYHSSAKKGEGENLYTRWSTDSADATCKEAVDEW